MVGFCQLIVQGFHNPESVRIDAEKNSFHRLLIEKFIGVVKILPKIDLNTTMVGNIYR